MLDKIVDLAAWLPARALMQGYMRRAGIGPTKALAKRYNRLRYAARHRRHQTAFIDFEALLIEDGLDLDANPVEMRDGWALDTSGTLPHLDRLLDDTAPLIAERAGRHHSSSRKPYFRGLLLPGDVASWPSFLDFALSSSVLATVGRYMGTVPVLSKTRPPGIRFMESSRALDPRPNPAPEQSQLFHRDLHDDPVVYVLVALQDITEKSGPWHFLPKSVSRRASRALGYQRRGAPYRVPDAVIYDVVDPSEVIRFVGPRGSVLFIDSGACFHFGSRDAVVPRYQMMYGFTTPCRTDFSQVFQPSGSYPTGPSASRLRRLVLA